MNELCIERSALIVIDMQRYFLARGAEAYLAPPRSLIPNALKLIAAFRERGLPLIITRHAHPKRDAAGQMGRWWNGKLPRLGDPESELIDEIKPMKGEIYLTKKRYSAFEGTDLARKLRRRRVKSLVICGVMTNLCVETTARHAFMKDFEPTIVKDACAAGSAKFQNASLTNLGYGFAHIVTTREMLSMMRRNP